MADDRVGDKLFEVESEPVGARAVTPVGAHKRFRPYDQSQSLLLPPSLDDWLPENHEARFISDVVDDMVDLGCIYDSYTEASGAPPYDPAMMVKLLLFAYSIGVTSSREMERRCHVDVAFRWLSANAAPDYRSLSRFRRRHLVGIDALFVQVLALYAEAGLVKLGRVALDGTKLRASASRHKAMSYDRIGPRIEELEAQVAAMLAEAEATDNAEDAEFGEDRRGDELPPELATKEGRLAKLRAAKESIEAEAKQKAAAKAQQTAKDQGATEEEVHAAGAKAAEGATPSGRAQRNFTDPESRMMKTNDGYQYAFNAQAMVDEEAQIIVGHSVSNQASDVQQLMEMIKISEATLCAADIEDNPDVVIADAGYFSERNVTDATKAGVDVLIATGRLKHHEQVPDAPRGPIPKDATIKEIMARRLRTKKGKADYARRKAIVEPVFGQMKVRQGAGFLRLRGLEGAQGEWALHSLCHNLRKLARAGA
ncbi:MAG: IS1182 family transposase [Actinomycetota bacterium]|jgi:transposase|nr:IS1182 family transposase [Actinomycetota bacterium]